MVFMRKGSRRDGDEGGKKGIQKQKQSTATEKKEKSMRKG